MLVFSGLLMLAWATLSFEPRPVAEMAETLQQWLNNRIPSASADQGAVPSACQIRSSEPLDGAPDRPDSSFRFLLRAQFLNNQAAAQARQSPGPVQEFVRKNFGMIDEWRVLDVVEVRQPEKLPEMHDPTAV